MRLRRKHLVIVGTTVLTAALAVAVAIPVRREIITGQHCAAITAYIHADGAVQTTGDGPEQISVLGDSYTAGDVLPDRSDRWVTHFAELENATIDFDGIGSTGFVKSGWCKHQTFGDRVHNLAGADLLIVDGGLNDVGQDGVRAAAVALIDHAQASRIVIVGPVDAPSRTGEAAVDAALRSAAASRGVQYVSALDWAVEFVDGLHMTPRGHIEYAELLAAAL